MQEETGYDARRLANEKDFLTLYINGQQTTMYIIVGVDETFPFEPQVRKEISAIEWFPLDALPKGSFGVEPFIPRLRRWMAKTKGVRAPKNSATPGKFGGGLSSVVVVVQRVVIRTLEWCVFVDGLRVRCAGSGSSEAHYIVGCGWFYPRVIFNTPS